MHKSASQKDRRIFLEGFGGGAPRRRGWGVGPSGGVGSWGFILGECKAACLLHIKKAPTFKHNWEDVFCKTNIDMSAHCKSSVNYPGKHESSHS